MAHVLLNAVTEDSDSEIVQCASPCTVLVEGDLDGGELRIMIYRQDDDAGGAIAYTTTEPGAFTIDVIGRYGLSVSLVNSSSPGLTVSIL